MSAKYAIVSTGAEDRIQDSYVFDRIEDAEKCLKMLEKGLVGLKIRQIEINSTKPS